MKRIRIYFRRTGKGDWFFSRLIGWWGKLFNKPLRWLPDYCHVELLFPNRYSTSANPLPSFGLCFSSARYDISGRHRTGVRFSPAKEVLSNPAVWDYFEIEVTDEEEQIMFDAATSIIGKGYDWIAILGFALPVRLQIEGRFFCSEAVNWVVAKIPRLLDKVYRWSPLASAGLYLSKPEIFGALRNLATGEIVAERLAA